MAAAVAKFPLREGYVRVYFTCTMSAESFVHLHCHTEYSTLDGAVRIEAAMKRAQKYKTPTLAAKAGRLIHSQSWIT